MHPTSFCPAGQDTLEQVEQVELNPREVSAENIPAEQGLQVTSADDEHGEIK